MVLSLPSVRIPCIILPQMTTRTSRRWRTRPIHPSSAPPPTSSSFQTLASRSPPNREAASPSLRGRTGARASCRRWPVTPDLLSKRPIPKSVFLTITTTSKSAIELWRSWIQDVGIASWIQDLGIASWIQEMDLVLNHWILYSSIGSWIQAFDLGFKHWILDSSNGTWIQSLYFGFNHCILGLYLGFGSWHCILSLDLGIGSWQCISVLDLGFRSCIQSRYYI